MHVPDGFLDTATSLATAGVAVAAVGLALDRSKRELDDRTVPLAGLTSAFIFAAQMITIPVGLGTSGHLMGGALAAVLVGPWTGILCLTVVLLVQGLLFADGGLTALGTNVTLLAVTTVVVGWLVTRGVLVLSRGRRGAVVPAAAVGAFASVVVAALVFVALFEIGGRADVPLGPLTASMLGWHAVIGLGEAVLTAVAVATVLAARPDLVHAVRGTRAPLVLRGPDGLVLAAPASVNPVSPGPTPRVAGAHPTVPATPRPVRPVLLGGGVLTILVAGGLSVLASGAPDGLERVASDRGFLGTARDHLLAASPLADYGDVGGIPVGVAGVLGVLVTVAVAAVVWAVARPAGRRAHAADLAGPRAVRHAADDPGATRHD